MAQLSRRARAAVAEAARGPPVRDPARYDVARARPGLLVRSELEGAGPQPELPGILGPESRGRLHGTAAPAPHTHARWQLQDSGVGWECGGSHSLEAWDVVVGKVATTERA